LEESLAEIQNKLGPKFKIPTMLLKIKKNKHKNKCTPQPLDQLNKSDIKQRG